MKRYLLTIRYDGLLASDHEMDAADSHTLIEGAKRLLAAHAYFWLDEIVPSRLFAETDAFHVRHTALRPGSCEYEFAINLLANGVWDIAKLTFEFFVIHSILAWRDQREFAMPERARREPYFEAPPNDGRSNRPMHDFGPNHELQHQRLQGRITQAMNQITVPLGRHATSAEMTFHGTKLGTWVKRVPRWSEDEISEAVVDYRSKQFVGEAPLR